MKEFVDLGLPSGTLWADTNEEGYFIFDVAKEKFGDSVPTIDEWRELIDNCEWLWDFRNMQMVVIGKNGNRITLPAAGYQDGTNLENVDSDGYYWSSSLNTDYPDDAYDVSLNSGYVSWGRDDCYDRQSVRCVSDTPQEGFIDMGNGLYLSEKNEKGYFTYDEAMKLFNS